MVDVKKGLPFPIERDAGGGRGLSLLAKSVSSCLKNLFRINCLIVGVLIFLVGGAVVAICTGSMIYVSSG